jgi:transcriptional regulator with XRE-family HTH domain
MKPTTSPRESRHLSVVPPKEPSATRLTRAQVAARLGISISTVRRYEGSRLHPHVDEDDVHWFDVKEVTALAAALANESRARKPRNMSTAAEASPSPGELAAQLFERFEQRQSLAEIVVGLRIEPKAVRDLFDQWCLGLTEGQLRMKQSPNVARNNDVERADAAKLAARLAGLPAGQLTRISVGRYRGLFQSGETEYNEVVELGGFHVSGPCTLEDISSRFGPGSYRVTAYGFEPAGLRWELLVGAIQQT